ncbi:Uncharacterised protein [Mycobacteroides abscessus]|nr:Uncharacterised protein [Mycobacteroides abscessus]
MSAVRAGNTLHHSRVGPDERGIGRRATDSQGGGLRRAQISGGALLGRRDVDGFRQGGQRAGIMERIDYQPPHVVEAAGLVRCVEPGTEVVEQQARE